MSEPRTRLAPSTDYLALKAATRDLVAACGGPRRVAGFSRCKESHLSEAGQPLHAERFAAIDQVLDMELECGAATVTRVLAERAGFDLVPKGVHDAQDPHQHLACIITATGEVSALTSEALADSRISVAEARAIAHKAGLAIQTLQALEAQLNVILRGGK